MIPVVRIYGRPTRQFCEDSRALPYMDAALPVHELLLSLGALRSTIAGETPNTTIVLENKNGEASKLLKDFPPIAARADILADGVVIFSGFVSGIQLSRTCSVDISI